MCRGGAFCGILLLSGLTLWLEPAYSLPLLYASFGASAVLIFGNISSPLAQPRNFIGRDHASHLAVRAWFQVPSYVMVHLAVTHRRRASQIIPLSCIIKGFDKRRSCFWEYV